MGETPNDGPSHSATGFVPAPVTWIGNGPSAGEPPGGRLRAGTAVIVVEPDADLRQELCQYLPSEWGLQAFSSLDEADGARVDAGRPIILVLGPSHATEASLCRTAATVEETQGAGALLVAGSLSPTLMRLALRAGLNDAISLQAAPDHLQEAVADLARRLESELARQKHAVSTAQARGRANAGYLTTVYSPKGGVGKSVVAVNLAAAIAQRTGEPVVIADLDLQFGDVAVMLRVQPRHTFADAISAGELLDEALLRSFLARHEKSGVWALAAPTSPSDANVAGPADMLHVLNLLRDMFPQVIVDTPPQLNESVLQAVAASDTVAFVVGMDVPSVKNAHLGLQAFELLQVQRDKVVVVLNRADSKVHLTWHDIEKALETKVDVGFPSEVTVPQAINQGQPTLVAYPRSRFAAQALQLADLVLARAQGVEMKPRRQ
jgi:pilus assembly protein CpaE